SVSFPPFVDTGDCIELHPASATSRPSSVNCSRTRVFGASCLGCPFSVTDVDRKDFPDSWAPAPDSFPQAVEASSRTAPARATRGVFTPYGRRPRGSRCTVKARLIRDPGLADQITVG